MNYFSSIFQFFYCCSLLFVSRCDHNRCGQYLLFSHRLTVSFHYPLWPDLRAHGHSHPTVMHGTVGPMFAMTTPVALHHHQITDGMTEKKKKKEDKDREKREKEKDKVSSISNSLKLSC